MSAIVVLFRDPPGPEGSFVEVEDEHGHSVNVGEWSQRPDGLWALRITADAITAATDG